VNVPKFLKDDLPLFTNIISDLFPGVKPEEDDGGVQLQMCKKVCVEKFKLTPSDWYYDIINKIKK
jgi:dynein heavy chain, axonemal